MPSIFQRFRNLFRPIQPPPSAPRRYPTRDELIEWLDEPGSPLIDYWGDPIGTPSPTLTVRSRKRPADEDDEEEPEA